MKVCVKYFLFAIFVFLNLNCSGKNPGGKQEYGTIVTFKKGAKIEFAAFNLEYVGEREQKSNFSNGNSFTFHYKDFTVSDLGNAANNKIVSWTTGTGLIEPIPFEFNNQKFTIELAHSEKYNKWLAEDELVITKN